MNIKLVVRVVGSLLIVIGLVMLTSVPVSWVMGDSHTVTFRLFTSSAIVIAFGGLARYFARGCSGVFGFREGLALLLSVGYLLQFLVQYRLFLFHYLNGMMLFLKLCPDLQLQEQVLLITP